MLAEDFIQALENSTAHRPIRDQLAAEVLQNPELYRVVIEKALDPTDKNHHKACWTLELVLENQIGWLANYLEEFCKMLPAFSHDGAIRSISKICMFTGKHHLKLKKRNQYFLTEKQAQSIIETCFDWLIRDTKVASKVYAMRTLFEFGKLHSWIYIELNEILPKDFASHSSAYHAAAKEMLKKMAKAK